MAFSFGTTTATPGFGGGFGTNTGQSTTGFGFGATATPATSQTGFGFGTAAATPASSQTGFGFGTAAATPASSGFGFGNVGTVAPQPAAGFGGFSGFGAGAATPASTATGFGLGTFGSATTAAPSTGFGGFGTSTGFGLPTATAPAATSGFGSTFNFPGITPAASSTGGFGLGSFGAPATTTTPFSFSSFGQPAASTGTLGGGFGTGTSFLGQGTTGFGGASAFGQGGGLFGAGFGAPANAGMFGQATAAAPGAPTPANNALTTVVTALSCPLVFGDERDNIMAKWNMVQAFWGTGKAYYSNTAPPIDFTPDNPFCRFKAVGYSVMPNTKNEDGLVALVINKKDTDVTLQQQQLVESVHRIMGSRPTLSMCVEGIKPAHDNRAEVIFYILERAQTGAARRIPAAELYTFLCQPNIRQQLATIEVEAVLPKSAPTPEQLKQYLDTPPAGIDPLLWEQAKLDNPDQARFIPVPMIGFSELHRRLKCQAQETKLHQSRLNLINGDVQELQRNMTTSEAKLVELKRKHLELGHRVLKVMVRQEVNRKLGFSVTQEEEQLRVQLEAIQAELCAPNQFKSRLNELMSQMRMQSHQAVIKEEDRYTFNAGTQEDLKQLLKQQQEGIQHLISVIREDFEQLSTLETSLKDNSHHRT